MVKPPSYEACNRLAVGESCINRHIRSGTYIQDLFHYWFEQKRRATAAEKQEQKRRRWKHKNEAIDPLDIDMPCHTQPTFVTEFLD